MIQKRENFLNEKTVKTTKQAHPFKGYAISYNAEILNSFSSELLLKDIESAIKKKLKKLLTELRGFKFVTTLVLVFKKIESDDKTKYKAFYSHSKAKVVINESDIHDLFELIYNTIISIIQKFFGKVQTRLLFMSQSIILRFQSIIP